MPLSNEPTACQVLVDTMIQLLDEYKEGWRQELLDSYEQGWREGMPDSYYNRQDMLDSYQQEDVERTTIASGGDDE